MRSRGQGANVAVGCWTPLNPVAGSISEVSLLFEDKSRTFAGTKYCVESDWEYLDRSSRIEAQRVRSFLNRWAAEYPADERPELVSRFTSGNRRNFESALFELVLFAVFQSLGCEVEIHPDLGHGNPKRPDFLVIVPGGGSVYVEAVLASEYNDADVAARKRADVVLNSIEGIDSPNFLLWIDAEGSPETPPRGRALARDVGQWLGSLDVDDVVRAINVSGLEGAPKMTWEHEGWLITFRPIPKRPDRRGAGQRAIGSISEGVRLTNAWEPIRDAIKSKGGRYGQFDSPLLVCVNAEALSVDRIDEVDALFGQEQHIFDDADLTAPLQMRRVPNGAWYGPVGAQYKRVSGAWIFRRMNSWNLATRECTVYFNPWAQTALPAMFATLAHAKVENGSVVWSEGQPLAEVLGLDASWPE